MTFIEFTSTCQKLKAMPIVLFRIFKPERKGYRGTNKERLFNDGFKNLTLFRYLN